MSFDAVAGDPLGALGPRESLRDAALRRLQGAIMAGVLTPGEVYSARGLGAQLGISATPVREAVIDLIKEGLVEKVPNKGFRVVQLTSIELDELTELRELIEVPTIRRVAEHGIKDEAGLDELRALADDLVRTAHEKDVIEHGATDLQFHLKLLSYGNNKSLVDTVHSLRIRSRLYGLSELADRGTLAATAAEHVELLAMICAGDRAGAEALMRRHIHHVRGQWATGESTAE